LKKLEKKEREIISDIDEKNSIPYEKWIVSFTDGRNSTIKISYREFFAQGFYEAYDTVMTYAEKQNLDVRWFKEKRRCGNKFSEHEIIKLESFCTYCNRKFNHQDPVPCIHNTCNSMFCSRNCMNDHIMLLHNNNV
jgi:hypothetical protein